MRRVVGILLACLIPVALAWWLALLPGRVSASFGDISFDASLPVVALLLLVLYVIVHVVLRLIAGLIGVPAQFRAIRAARHRTQGDAALTRGLLALAAGEGADARRHVGKARKLLGDTPHTLLLAAEAGHKSARPEEATAAFQRLADHPEAAFLGIRGLMQQAIARQDWPEAAALAKRAEAARPGTGWLREERYRLALQTRDWREALTLAPPDAPRATLAAAAAQAEPDSAKALRLAKEAVEADPTLPAAALTYATQLRTAGKERRAMATLRAAWTANPQPDIATLALAPVTDPLARYKAAASFALANPGHIESEVLLAQTALAANLTGEARRHAEAAQALSNQRRVGLLLADIAEAEGDATTARTALRAAAAPDPAWRCGQCGGLHGAWAPVCSSCGTTGRIAWSEQPASPVVQES